MVKKVNLILATMLYGLRSEEREWNMHRDYATINGNMQAVADGNRWNFGLMVAKNV